MEYYLNRDIVDVVQIYPRTIRERQAVHDHPDLATPYPNVLAPGTVAASLPRVLPIANL
jgi:hypothetical protein